MDEKIKVLAAEIEEDVESIKINDFYGTVYFDTPEGEYIVLTEDERQERITEYIKESVWAFNTDFILDHSKLENWNSKVEDALRKIQRELCESANDLILAIIEDIDEFIEDAVQADGYGHFLSGYDGNEIEAGNYYIYRTS